MSTRKTPSNDDGADRGPLLGALLRLSHQALLAELNAGLAAAGYGDMPPNHAAARTLWDHPDGVRATELAAAARITKQSMAALIDQLEVSGYVERIDHPADKRAKLVRLTKRGREAGRVARNLVRRVESDWANRIGKARLAVLKQTLADLMTSLDADAGLPPSGQALQERGARSGQRGVAQLRAPRVERKRRIGLDE